MRSALPALLGALAASAKEVDDGSCPVGGSCRGAAGEYPWPNVRGQVGRYGISNLTVPKPLPQPNWMWRHASGQYGTVVVGGPVIDHEGSLYFTEMRALIKMSSHGQLLWSASPPDDSLFPDGPSIYGGGVFQTTMDGSLCRYDMGTGVLDWCNKYYPKTGSDSKYVSSHDGVVIIGTDDAGGGGSKHVLGIDAASGKKIWDFAPDTPTWNNMGIFTDDDTFILQDWDAKVYRLGLHNGSLLWKSGGQMGKTWTDGGAIIGANGLVYAVHGAGGQTSAATPFKPGKVAAYRLSDGEFVWSREVQHGIYTWPVVGQLNSDERWTVVIASGAIPPCVPWKLATIVCVLLLLALGGCFWSLREALRCARRCCTCKACGCAIGPALGRLVRTLLVSCILGLLLTVFVTQVVLPSYAADITAFDAETGATRWHHELPAWERIASRGDEEGLFQRITATPWRACCCPASFGSPSVDGDGTVYIGRANGLLYAIKDSNEDGKIQDSEVQTLDAEAAFLHSGPAFAPGIFAFSTCDSVWVWNT